MQHIIRQDIVELIWNKERAQVLFYVCGCMVACPSVLLKSWKKRETWVFEPETKVTRRNFMVLHFCPLEGFYIFLWSIRVQTHPTQLQMSSSGAQNRKLKIGSSILPPKATKRNRYLQWFIPRNIKTTECLRSIGLKNKGRRVSFGLWFLSLEDINIACFPSNKEEGIFSCVNTWHSYSF